MRIAKLLTAALAAAIGSAFALGAGVAQANRIAILSCHGPGGEALGHDGWTIGRTADGAMAALDTCTSGGGGTLSLELAGNNGGYGDEARIEWDFFAPPWARITSYAVQISGSYTAPFTGGGVGQVFVIASDESDPDYDYRNLGYASLGPTLVERTPPAADTFVVVNASCDGQNGRCAANTRIARADVSSTRVTLNDPSTPTVTSLTGSLLAPGPLREAAALDVQAADEGPGIYSAQLIVDGSPQPAQIFDTNGGWCQSLGPVADAGRSFSHPDPCPARASTTVPLETAGLADGRHTVQLRVDDASGNASTALETTVETQNAPRSTSAPTVSGPEGGVLTATPGTWSAPSAAGPISYGYSWQECNAGASGCTAIPGASGSTLSTGALAPGQSVRALVSASDRDGVATASSAGTPVILAPTGVPNGFGASESARVLLSGPGALTREYSASALKLSGRLLSPDGQPIAGASLDLVATTGASSTVVGHAQSDPDGRFLANVPPGPSRALAVAYRGFSLDPGYSASASVHELVRAGVQLNAGPRRTPSGGRVLFSGRALGALPRDGVIVELLVRYRGRWEPIRTPRTGADGRFRIAYVFQGARGTFPFRVLVPGGQADYPYAAGNSRVVDIRSG